MKNLSKETVLLSTVEYGTAECIPALVQAGAEVNGTPALMIALRKRQKTCVAPLLEAGADVNQGD